MARTLRPVLRPARRRASRPASLVALAVTAALVAGCGDDQPAAAPSSSAVSSASTSSVDASPASSSPAAPACGAAELRELTLRQKLAQMLVVGVTGAQDARSIVEQEQIGGIFIGSWSDLSMLSDGSVKAIASESRTPLMVTVDQEGGRVSRLSSLGIDLPSARQMVAQGMTAAQVRELAESTGRKLAKLGITVDFAPVVDVSDEDDDEVIGDRSFSNDPAVVTEYAQAFSRGLQDAGVMPVFKHFPGHGHGSGDSHLGVVRTPPLSQLRQSDLVPYQTLLRDPGNAGVMMGHLIVPGLTGAETPASISPAAIGMLRNGKKYDGPRFRGVIFSDDLSGMKAISARYPIDQAVLKSIRAGIDVALWLSTDQVPKVLDTLVDAVKSGKLTEKRVDRSVVRVLRAKGALTC